MKCLPENSLGSRIVRTTRIVAIANKWRSDPNDWRHEMLEEQLSGREWVKDVGRFRTTLGMLAMKADLVGEGLHYYHPIVHMCGGTPLALHCMLSAVAKVREKEGEHAKRCGAVADEVQNHVMENGIHDTPGFEALVESLQLSYDDLPHHMLKTCLLYCSIYPDGQSFEKKILVRRFISERFVYTEKEGKSYIEELLNRGLILPCTVKSGNLTIDYMMRNFLRWKSRQDNFITCMSEITPSSIIRRLCICNSPPKSRDATVDPLSGLDWYHIRSLVISEGIERVPFEKLEGLRVLDLCWIKSLPDHQRRDICCLVRLRHMLGLRISELPPEIVRLQCLETFEAAEGDRLAPQLAGGFTGNLQQVQTPELRGPAITQLPREIWALQHLHTLRIRDTHISELPKEIAELQQLKILDISYTYITVLPKEIGELQQLNILDISHSDITMLPKEIGELKQLKILDISHTDITVLPKEIGELQQLKILDISYTNITVLPKEVGQLQQLKSLDIGNTHITVLPMEIRELQKLKTLDITNTGITLLPKVIGELQHLEHLFLTGTEVAKIPREIGALKELKKLKLAGSKAALPLEVCALVELPECIQQVFNKNGLVSELAGELLSFRQSLNTLKSAGGTGGLVVGAKQMHMPRWISQHFNDLAVLDIRICKLEKQGLKILREMPKLEDLTLRFEVVPKEPAVISSEGFATLSDLTIESRVPRVTFQEGAMPKLYSLKFRFQFYAGPAYEDPVGINHLRGLSSIKFKCNEGWYGGGDSPCIRRTIDVVKKEAQELPRLHKFEVCGCKEMIYKPPPPLRIGQQREMEQGEMEEEEWERSIGEVEIEEEIIQA